MTLNWHSNWFSLIAWAGMILLCISILWASEHEQQVRDFIVTRFLGPLAAPSPEEEADYDNF